MKRIVTSLLLIVCLNLLFAQQQALITHYMYNGLIYNPAVSGTEKVFSVDLNTRRQWVGIKEAPITQTISAHSLLDKTFGAGGFIFNQVTGPTRRTGLSISSAYHLDLSKTKFSDAKLSFGLAFSLSQFTVDRTQLITRINNDPAVEQSFNNLLSPDASFGLYYFAPNYYMGFSALNLIQSKVDLLNSDPNTNTVVRNYYLTAGGNVEIQKDISLSPSLLFQMIESLPYQIDVSLLGWYKEMVSFGISYRNNDAICGMLGYKNKTLRIGYSYDYGVSDLNSFNSGSHEISMTLFLSKSKFFR